MVAEYHNQSKLRFWCQMVLPLVYDDSLSYMELLNKVVTYLNNCIQDVGNCETNIESLLEAFVNLQDYVNEITEDISPLIEEKIDEMIESGEFGEILADALATLFAPEYDTTESYIPLNYVIKDGQLYCCTANTTGEWDNTKWRETTVGDELNTLMQKVYSLNAGDVSFDPTATYASGTVGNKLKNLTANDVEYNSSQTYNNATVGKELSNLNGAITSGTLLNGMPQAEMRIPANSDFNSYTTAGTYYVNSDADAGTIAHIPRSASGTLFVINRAVVNYKTQYYITTSSAEIIFVRNYNSGSWTSWKTYFTSEHDNANIAKVLEDWIAPAGGLKQDEVIFGPNGMLYKAITAISANDTLNIGTNIDSTIISDHLVEMGTWTPHIYDLNTYVRNATYQGQYIKAGNIIILTYSTPDVAGAGEDFSGINTMLQYRNLPYSATIVGGSTSFTNDLGDYHSIQAGIFGRVYFRPNIKSSDFSDATKVAFGFFAFGIVSN